MRMKDTNVLATAAALSDQDLLARIDILAGREREATAELVAHLAALDARPNVYAAKGYGSLFGYCTQALGLSEDAACNRIETARACRRFPVILELLGDGSMTLTSVRLLGRHLTPSNHETVLARASGRSRHEIDVLVAELAPRPDVPSSVRKVPIPATAATVDAPATHGSDSAPPRSVLPAVPRPIVQPTAPERYRVQFTIGKDTHQKLRRVQDLLRREVPSGDPAVLFDRALTLLLAKVENTKFGVTDKPRLARSIRPGTDMDIRTPPRRRSRYIARPVKRAVAARDDGRCTFVGAEGRRCTERVFLDFHHGVSYAKGGPTTVENISQRCWRHNQYDADLVFGRHRRRGGPPRNEGSASHASERDHPASETREPPSSICA